MTKPTVSAGAVFVVYGKAMDDEQQHLIRQALAGDSRAGEELLGSIQHSVFNLALRYLGDPGDVQDACQEICLKVWSKLDRYRGEARFSTWVLAIAGNHLRDVRKSRLEQAGLSFEAYEAEVGTVPATRSPVPGLDEALLAEELRHSCSLGMLQCLDRTDRLIYVLHCFFAVSSDDGGLICQLSPAAYRQRLSRVHKKMAAFLTRVCGLAGDGQVCTCQDRVLHAFRQGRISPERLYFATHLQPGAARQLTADMEALHAESAVFRHGETFRHPEAVTAIRKVLAGTAPGFLTD